jgi:hypothetical protein
MEHDFSTEEAFEAEPGHGFEGDGADLDDADSPYAGPLPGEQPLLDEVDEDGWF